MRLLIILAGLLLSCNGLAQSAIGKFGDWEAYKSMQGGRAICYIASFPIKNDGNYKSRNKPYLLVTHRPGNISEVSVSAGYPYKDKSTVKVTVDGKTNFTLFTAYETPQLAWARDARSDKAVISRFIKGNKAVIKGYSGLGSHSIDTYSLSGFTKAYNSIKNACR